MAKLNDKELDQAFDGSKEELVLFTSYMKRKYTQVCMLDFSTSKIVTDRNNHIDHDIAIDGIILDIKINDMTWHNKKEKFTLITPKITFAYMCKEKGFDFRNEYGRFMLQFIVYSYKKYELVSVKALDNGEERVKGLVEDRVTGVD